MTARLVDLPGCLRDPQQLALRRQLAEEEFMRPLSQFAEFVRRDSGQANVPDFDPLDGGIHAECLFILEAPGPQALNTGFVSRNNPSQTSSNLWHLTKAAGMERKRTAVWNCVPWYIGDETGLRAAKPADVTEGLKYLRLLIELLTKLRIAVLVGRAAGRNRATLTHEFPHLQLFEIPHPSPQWVNRAPQKNKEAILNGLLAVQRVLSVGEQDASSHPSL